MASSRPSKQTLENPLLYSQFRKQLRKIDSSFDTELIDRSLTPDEAWHELTRRHNLRPKKVRGLEETYVDEMRDVLYDMGIKHPRLQNYVIKEIEKSPEKFARNMEQDPDILAAAYLLQMRPLKNVRLDIARKAKTCKSLRQWTRAPNRCDIQGVDSKGARFDAGWFG